MLWENICLLVFIKEEFYARWIVSFPRWNERPKQPLGTAFKCMPLIYRVLSGYDYLLSFFFFVALFFFHTQLMLKEKRKQIPLDDTWHPRDYSRIKRYWNKSIDRFCFSELAYLAQIDRDNHPRAVTNNWLVAGNVFFLTFKAGVEAHSLPVKNKEYNSF